MLARSGARLIVRQYYAPTSFVNAEIPANVKLDPASDAGVTGLQAATRPRAGYYAPTFGVSAFSRPLLVATADTPRVPVKLTRITTHADTKLNDLIAALGGVPVPPEWAEFSTQAKAAGDTDRACVVYVPELDEEWDFWRLDPDGAGGYTASAGLRIAHVSRSPGYPVDRWYKSMYYDPIPTAPAQLADFEMRAWSTSASHLSLGALMVTEEDLWLGRIEHALAFAAPDYLVMPGQRWPAQGNDGWVTGAPLQEGMRFQLDPSIDVPDLGLHPLATLCLQAAQHYGWVLADKGRNIGIGGEPACKPYMLGTRGYQVLDGTPWGSFRLLAAGTAANPNPTA